MIALLVAAGGLSIGGPWASLGCLGLFVVFKSRRPTRAENSFRPILLVLLVELRSGRSTLAALQQAAATFLSDRELSRGTRVATVSGLTAAVSVTSGDTRRLFAQLARSQRSGSPVADTVRSMLDSDIASERSRRLTRARSLPVRLMVPVALFLLPGLVLLLYAPSLLRLLDQMTGPFS